MPVAVRNLKTGPTVFSDLEGAQRIQIEWQGKGDPSGLDVQEVPDTLLQNTQFRRALNRGILVQISDEEAAAALAAQTQAHAERGAAATASALGAIDQAANNDLVSMPCQGPNARGTGECGTPVPVRESARGQAPVLCSQHSSLASVFIEVETGEMYEQGDRLVPRKQWVRPTLTATETA